MRPLGNSYLECMYVQHVCMYECMCMYVCMYVKYMYVQYMYVCKCVCKVNVYVCMCLMYVCMNVCMHVQNYSQMFSPKVFDSIAEFRDWVRSSLCWYAEAKSLAA